MTLLEAVHQLLAILPRCCGCEVAIAVLYNDDRWPLCEACWRKVPCSKRPPAPDLREAMRAIVEAQLRASG